MTDATRPDSRLYPERPFLAVSVAVFRGQDVLLASRGRPPFQNVFTLPGGIVEAGETLEEAALRELDEETGVSAEIIGFTGYTQVLDRDDDGRLRRHFVICSFAARWLSGDGVPGEELPVVRWTDLASARNLELTPGLMPILERGRALVPEA